ncbi:MAG: DUF6240 domain-containing protein [Lachnospiraceae bacterium]|nr:DUF6240 domain-containing protein [Lachnospiraceae bacterium]
MKISFDTMGTNQNVDNVTTAYSTPQTAGATFTGGISLDISDKVTDNSAYGGQGKTTEDVSLAAGLTDVENQRNYMAVMSNTMSEEDFGKMLEEGADPNNMKIEEVVTIVDHIKVAMIKGGASVIGYTDTLDQKTLTEITGSETFANVLKQAFHDADIPLTKENAEAAVKAYDQIKEKQELSQGAKKYLVTNQLPPTVENIYKAQFSSTEDANKQGRGYFPIEVNGYYSQKAEEIDFSKLQKQIEKVIEEAGLPVNETTKDQAKWLVEKGIPLTGENLINLVQIEAVAFPVTEQVMAETVAVAIANGKKAAEANLSDTENIYEKAVRISEETAGLTEEAVDQVVESGKELTLQNIEQAAKELTENKSAEKEIASDATAYKTEIPTKAVLDARLKLAEVQLQMTAEANLKLLKSNYAIETTDLEQLIKDLKLAKETLYPDMTEEEISLYEQTAQRTEILPYLPAALVGRLAEWPERSGVTVEEAYQQGSSLQAEYKKASQTYETLMTAPRKDLGDKIQTAFRNVDDILTEMNLKTTAENRRAVRILGYNSMEITTENIEAVQSIDEELQIFLKKITPQKTLDMIRDGINPLETDISELNEYFEQSEKEQQNNQEKNSSEKADSYSKFLYKLEQKKEISPEERTTYIGIYRMLHQLNEDDGASVGTVLENGEELSFQSLLSAMRSAKRAGMDIIVDDTFAGLNGTRQNAGIDEQIYTYYKSLEQSNTEEDGKYQGELLKDYRQAATVSDEVVEDLLTYNRPVSVNNLLAAEGLLYRGNTFREIHSLFDRKANRKENKDTTMSLKEATDHMLEKLSDEEDAVKAYEDFTETLSSELDTLLGNQDDTYVDVKAIAMLHKQLSLAGSLAKEECYQIPITTDGDTTTMQLRIEHGTGEHKVTATIAQDNGSSVAAEFRLTEDGNIQGYIASDQRDVLDNWTVTGQKRFAKELGKTETEFDQLHMIYSEKLDVSKLGKETESNGMTEEIKPADTKELYAIAKAFVKAMQGGIKG